MRRPYHARFLVPSLLVTLCFACERRDARPEPPVEIVRDAPIIAFLGDSLTSGYGLAAAESYPALIQARIDHEGLRYRVHNAGVAGDTSTGCLGRVDWVFRRTIAVLVVATGANDGLRGIPRPTTEANLRTIVRRARGRRARVVLAGVPLPHNFGEADRAAFADVYARVARDENVPLIPSLLEGVAMEPGLNQSDGIHPNARGAARIAETVWATLSPMLSR
jgi:acyl-CoA thioesterase-1